jgi:hypothetical protein
MTGKQRMLAAYRGEFTDRITIAPEFWYYYPAKILGVDMIEFMREVPFHEALLTTFTRFNCEGWGVVFGSGPNERVTTKSFDRWIDNDTLEVRHETKTPYGTLGSGTRYSRDEPDWSIEKPIKNFVRDLSAWECIAFGDDLGKLDPKAMTDAWGSVGEAYLLEAWLGVPFFDTVAGAFDGGMSEAVAAFFDYESEMKRIQKIYIEHLIRKIDALCDLTPFESFCIGCSWSNNSLLGPDLWRKWDKPGIQAAAEAIHRRGRLLHIHFHGRCMETVADFAEIGIDCVCPFERPPGGDVIGLEGLREVARLLDGTVTMNGNVHTVETLIRGGPADARREVSEIIEAFAGNPRVIIGTGDQVGRETPEENLHAMIEEAVRLSPPWRNPGSER